MEHTETKSNRKLLIGLGVLVALGVVAGIAVYALLSGGSKPQTAKTNSQQPFPRVATKDQITQNLSDLKDSLKQAQSDTASTKTNLQESQKQIKVGN